MEIRTWDEVLNTPPKKLKTLTLIIIFQDTAEVIQEDEGISKADWLTLKGGITNERDVLTKIKEDREEFREVSVWFCHCLFSVLRAVTSSIDLA